MLWKRSSMATTILRLENDELRIADANPKILATLGRTLEEVVGLSVPAFFPAFVATVAHLEMFETLARGASDLPGLDTEVEQHVDGELHRAYQVIAYGGDPGTVAVQLNDISARKREEYRLRRRDAVQRELLELLPQAVYWCDARGRYVDGNRALCELVGVDGMDELSGQLAAERTPQLAELFRSPVYEPALDRELELPTPEGPPRTMLWSRVPLHAEGELAGFVGILHDISARKLLERELLERKESLEQAVQERTRELASQLSVISAQRETIHDLSTPIIQVWEGIIVLPLIGTVDARRSLELTRELLDAIERLASRCVIIDVTGIDDAELEFPHHLARIARAARLLGCRCVVCGLHPRMAQALATQRAELGQLVAQRNLQSALHECIAHLESSAR